MKLDRLPPDPGALVGFFEEGLAALGAVSERTHYDRLQIVAEGPAATLWRADGTLLETEVRFIAPEETGPRDAAREVFPGCPLTFRLAELLRPTPLALDRAAIAGSDAARSPSEDVAEKLWRQQFPGTARWRLASDWRRATHFNLVALMRCEVQAIDQHWSAHRVAISLRDGARDETLATDLAFAELDPRPASLPWPSADPALWGSWLAAALEAEVATTLTAIRQRQERYLQRELERVDQYFTGYEQELAERAARSGSETARVRLAERLAAAKAEHARRRQDQVRRHEIRVLPQLDALLLLAEPAWEAEVSHGHHHDLEQQTALYLPRGRRWIV